MKELVLSKLGHTWILDLDGTFSNAVIWGYDGSTAESYAKKYNRTFKI